MLNRKLLIVFAIFAAQMQAQNNTKSLYSFYGLGEIQPTGSVATRTLGGSNLGIMPGQYPNLANPLSLAGRKSVDFEIGLEGNTRLQQTLTAKKTDLAGNVSYISLGFNVLHKDYLDRDSAGKSRTIIKRYPVRYNMMLGLAPYAAMDYDFAVQGDSNTFRTLYSAGGRGSLTSLYWNHALQLLDTQLTLGFSAQYLFGTYAESSLKNLINDSNSIGYEQTINQRITGTKIGASIAYTNTLSKKAGLIQSFAGQYQFDANLKNDAYNFVRTVSDFFAVKDTLQFSNTAEKVFLPGSLRFGYGLQKDHNWSLSLDYLTQKMSAYSNSAASSQLMDIQRYNLGLQLNPERIKYASEKLNPFQRVEWRTGVYYQNGPYAVKINNNLTSINEYGINFGAGIPMIKKIDRVTYVSYVNIGLQYAQRGNNENGLVKENIFRVNLSMHLSDLWFRKFNYN